MRCDVSLAQFVLVGLCSSDNWMGVLDRWIDEECLQVLAVDIICLECFIQYHIWYGNCR